MNRFRGFRTLFWFLRDLFDAAHNSISKIFNLFDLSLVLTTSFWGRRLLLFFLLKYKSIFQKVMIEISYLLIIVIMSTMRTSLYSLKNLYEIDLWASCRHLCRFNNFLIEQFKCMVLRLTFLSFFCLFANYQSG